MSNDKAAKMTKPTAKTAFDTDTIRALAEILNETSLTEIEVEDQGLRIRVARQANVQQVSVAAPQFSAPLPVAAPSALSSVAAAANVNTAAQGTVPSPMVGTAYLASAPDKPNFVEIGQSVKVGQTLLIIEAMKTFNEIPSPRAGKVVEILVGSGDPVEFGQPLVVVA